MKEYIEKETDGNVRVNIYAGGQMGGEEETLEQVAQGSLEMAVASFAPVVSYDSEFEVWISRLCITLMRRHGWCWTAM